MRDIADGLLLQEFGIEVWQPVKFVWKSVVLTNRRQMSIASYDSFLDFLLFNGVVLTQNSLTFSAFSAIGKSMFSECHFTKALDLNICHIGAEYNVVRSGCKPSTISAFDDASLVQYLLREGVIEALAA